MTPSSGQLDASAHALVVLMIEHEQPEGLSSRKLVVETAKHNVLTAYDIGEGLQLLHRFPNVDLVLVHETLLEDASLLGEIRRVTPKVPIVVASPQLARHIDGADFVISSYDPQALLDLLAQKFHIPRAPAER